MYFKFKVFRIIVSCLIISEKNVWLPPIFVLDSNSLFLNLLLPRCHKRRKNTSVLRGTVHKAAIFTMLKFWFVPRVS